MQQKLHSSDHKDDSNAEQIEPQVDPDSNDRMAEERPEPPHEPSHFDAGNGQGTVTGPPYDEQFQERPILDGSTQNDHAEAAVPNPYRGMSDPAMIKRQPALNKAKSSRWLIASAIAAAVISVVLLALAPWSPLWSGVGVLIAVGGLLLMLVIRASKIKPKVRLRLEALLLGIVWAVPLAIALSILFTSADEIWP